MAPRLLLEYGWWRIARGDSDRGLGGTQVNTTGVSSAEQTTEATGQGHPFAKSVAAMRGANLVGACSLQQFAAAGSLSHTHEDAQGFLDNVGQTQPPNFWFKESAVQYWSYSEPYDNWQDTYGADAVAVFYHSGHGGMADDAVFTAPLGADWGNRTSVNSSDLVLGNEMLRYIYWSTCCSLRVHDGHSQYHCPWCEFRRSRPPTCQRTRLHDAPAKWQFVVRSRRGGGTFPRCGVARSGIGNLGVTRGSVGTRGWKHHPLGSGKFRRVPGLTHHGCQRLPEEGAD